MYIIQITSKVTGISMYFTGYIVKDTFKHIVHQTWSVDRRFATQFRTEALADTLADAFRNNNDMYKVSVEYEAD